MIIGNGFSVIGDNDHLLRKVERSKAFEIHKFCRHLLQRSHCQLSPTPIAVEASTAFSMGGVPDPIFSRPNIKEKIAVWLRETILIPHLEYVN